MARDKRPDLVKLIPKDVKTILDIGCSTAELGMLIKNTYQGIQVIRIETNKEMAEIASQKLDKILL